MNAAYPKVNFWDNLIPLRGGPDGPQLAGWTPGPPAKGGLGCVLYADQMIPVDDGVSLAADVYTPKALHYGAETYVELSRVPTQAE